MCSCNNSCVWLVNDMQTFACLVASPTYCKNTITPTQATFLPWRFGLYQRPLSEEVCSITLPVLATIVMRRGKKWVVRVAHRVAPLIPVQGLPSFSINLYCTTYVALLKMCSRNNSCVWLVNACLVASPTYVALLKMYSSHSGGCESHVQCR